MIDLGSVYRITATVRDASGTLTDPATATLTITLPDGSTASPAVPLPSTTAGQLVVDYTTTQAGRHVWRMVTTSPATAYTDVFDVRPATPGVIVSLSDAKAQLNVAATYTDDDEELRRYIGAVTGVVEREVGRVVARRSITERQSLDVAATQVLLSNVPVISLTSVATVDGATTWAVSDLDVDGDSGLATVLAGEPLGGDVEVTYDAGMAIVPENYQLAALIILQHLWETQRGKSGPVPGGGDLVVPAGYAVPNRARELLGIPLPGVA